MTLQLDARQRAMLAEMGIRLFEPSEAAPASGAAIATPTPAVLSRQMPQAAPERSVAERTARRDEPAPAPRLAAAVPLGERPGELDAMDWQALEQAVAACRACKLCNGRRNTVFGVGDREADWLVVGEAPGENEDIQAEPFVGQAGKLLDNMLAALKLDRHHNVYIANVLKCRPPGNRNPEPEEVAQCEPFLRRQVQLLRPRIILAMGRFAVQSLLQTNEPIGKLRGRVHQYNGVPVVVTYHPAYLLRNLADKGKAWADLCLALEVMRGGDSAAAGR